MDSRPSGAGRAKIGITWAVSLFVTAVIVFFGATRYQGGVTGNAGDPAVRRQLLVAAMRTNLARAAEMEKCAVLSDRDEESASFAEASKTASTAIDRDLGRLRKLIGGQGSSRERELLGRFERSWESLKQIDAGLLLSAPQNTKAKAIELSGTIGAELLQKFHEELGKATLKASPASKRVEMEKLAGQAESAMLGIALLQMRHLHAPSAAEKTALEIPMNDSRKRAEAALKSMDAVSGKKRNTLLNGAATVLGEFMQLNEEIVRLSNIEANESPAEVSLGRKRLAETECDHELKALQSPGIGDSK
ncbi:MAG: hypothetical protein HGB02_00595 [Chlorobiaceae bacterium]|nr:hypothetical protein [Chlorobiaceae bacterium]